MLHESHKYTNLLLLNDIHLHAQREMYIVEHIFYT